MGDLGCVGGAGTVGGGGMEAMPVGMKKTDCGWQAMSTLAFGPGTLGKVVLCSHNLCALGLVMFLPHSFGFLAILPKRAALAMDFCDSILCFLLNGGVPDP